MKKLKTFKVEHTVLVERVYYGEVQCETWEEAKAWAQHLENFPEDYTEEPSEISTHFDDMIIQKGTGQRKRWSEID